MLPVIPKIAENAPPCVDPSDPASVDNCPGNSVCFPGNLHWLPKDSIYYNRTGLGFCACYTVHSVEGDDCATLMPWGYAQIFSAFTIAIVSFIAFVITVSDGTIFVCRVTKASKAYRDNEKAAEEAWTAHRRRHPEAARVPRPPTQSAAPLSVWHWLSNDPSFPLLLSSSVCFAILIYVASMDIEGALDPNVLKLVGRYKSNPSSLLLAFTFGILGVNNVSLILLGVAWIQLAHKTSKKYLNSSKLALHKKFRRVPLSGANESTSGKGSTFSLTPPKSFLSQTQRVGLYWLEIILRVCLIAYPILAIVTFTSGYVLPTFILSYVILFLMCVVFAVGTCWVEKLLEKSENFLRKISKQGDLPSRRHRADALSRMNKYVHCVSLVCAFGICLIIASGAIYMVDSSRTGLTRLAGRDMPAWHMRLRMWAAYLNWVGVLVCSCATSWFGRKFTRGLDLEPARLVAANALKKLSCNACSSRESDEDETAIHAASSSSFHGFRRSILHHLFKTKEERPALNTTDDSGLQRAGGQVRHSEQEGEVQEVERFFFDPQMAAKDRAFHFTVQEVAQPIGNNNNNNASIRRSGRDDDEVNLDRKKTVLNNEEEHNPSNTSTSHLAQAVDEEEEAAAGDLRPPREREAERKQENGELAIA